MTRAVRLADLENMPPAERNKVLGGLVTGAHSLANGRIEALEAEIREYERRYEMSSESMMQQLAEGKLKETAEIASWLIRLRIRERAGATQAG